MKKQPSRKKQAMGRPRKRYGRKDLQVAFKVTAEQKDRYVRASDAARMELSEWLRLVCDRAAGAALESHQRAEQAGRVGRRIDLSEDDDLELPQGR